MAKGRFGNSVFINCPFDDGYEPIFAAIVFAVHDLGFVTRSAKEDDDSGEVRITKIERIIEQCKFGIHDISEVRLDSQNHLPRFNMPLELGIFMGCKRFGGPKQNGKICLILDAEPYRYQKFISDIAGQDIRIHRGSPERAIVAVRNWLATTSERSPLPGGAAIVARYQAFRKDLPKLCEEAALEAHSLTLGDLLMLLDSWEGMKL